MSSKIIARSELSARSPAAVERERRAALERTYAEAGLPAELAYDLDLLWRQPPEPPPPQLVTTNSSDLTADEIAALEPVFNPLWRSRHGSITWVALLDALLTTRPGPVRTRRDPELKRAIEQRRSLLRRLATTHFWELAGKGIEALQTLGPQRKSKLLSICCAQNWRAEAMRKRSRKAES